MREGIERWIVVAFVCFIILLVAHVGLHIYTFDELPRWIHEVVTKN